MVISLERVSVTPFLTLPRCYLKHDIRETNEQCTQTTLNISGFIASPLSKKKKTYQDFYS